jgi:hypothetical protein
MHRTAHMPFAHKQRKRYLIILPLLYARKNAHILCLQAKKATCCIRRCIRSAHRVCMYTKLYIHFSEKQGIIWVLHALCLKAKKATFYYLAFITCAVVNFLQGGYFRKGGIKKHQYCWALDISRWNIVSFWRCLGERHK